MPTDKASILRELAMVKSMTKSLLLQTASLEANALLHGQLIDLLLQGKHPTKDEILALHSESWNAILNKYPYLKQKPTLAKDPLKDLLLPS